MKSQLHHYTKLIFEKIKFAHLKIFFWASEMGLGRKVEPEPVLDARLPLIRFMSKAHNIVGGDPSISFCQWWLMGQDSYLCHGISASRSCISNDTCKAVDVIATIDRLPWSRRDSSVSFLLSFFFLIGGDSFLISIVRNLHPPPMYNVLCLCIDMDKLPQCATMFHLMSDPVVKLVFQFLVPLVLTFDPLYRSWSIHQLKHVFLLL